MLALLPTMNTMTDSTSNILRDHAHGRLRCASQDFGEVSKLQYEYRKKLFDLYSKHRDEKDDEYFKEVRALEREQKKAVQQAAKEIYDKVKAAIGSSQTVNGKEVSNRYNFWLYKGNTGMKITATVNGKKVMTLKCSRDINHDESGALETVQVVAGNEDVLNKKKDKDKYLHLEARDAKDIIKIYTDHIKKLIR